MSRRTSMYEHQEEVMLLWDLGMRRLDIAKRFGCSVATISNIINGKTTYSYRQTTNKKGNNQKLVQEIQKIRETYFQQEKYVTEKELKERNEQIVSMRKSGMTYPAIGKKFGLSRQRIKQIVDANEERF